MCLLAISDYCDYDSSTSSSDDLPDVQIQIGLGAERSLLHNTQQRSQNTTSPSCNDGNNVLVDDAALVDASCNNGHDTLPQDTNVSYDNDNSYKDLAVSNSNTSSSGSDNTAASDANGHNSNAPQQTQNMDIIMNQSDALAPTENQPETSEVLRVDSSLNDFPRKLDINKETNEIMHHCYVNNLVNPVEILRHMLC